MIRALLPIMLLLAVFCGILGFMWDVREMRKEKKSKNVFYNPDDPSVEKEQISKHQHALMAIGRAEHELDGYLGLELLPHNDSWVENVCLICVKKNESQRKLEDRAAAKRYSRSDGYAPHRGNVFDATERMDLEAKRKAELSEVVERDIDL